jgi:energy-coupling factor transport system permease protein
MSSRFEFLGDTAIGQYIPSNSWFHRRDPRARLLAFIIVFMGVTFSVNLWGLGIGLIGTIAIFLLAQLSMKPAFRMVKRALPFIIILGVIQIVFSSPQDADSIIWTIFSLEISQSVLLIAIILILRFIILIILLNAFAMCLSTAQITAALFYLLKPVEKIGFPVNDLTMVAQITLRFLPMIAQMAEIIAKAQASRGGDWEQRGFNPIRQAKRVLPLIVPLMVNSLKQAETMAVAMESRGFNAAEQRSSLYELNFMWQDSILLILALLLSMVMVISGWAA